MRFLIIFLLITSPLLAAEYHGQKDRYNEALLRNDPEVLVSTPNKKQEIVVVIQEPVKDPPVRVSACVEWNGECQESDEFKATVQ